MLAIAIQRWRTMNSSTGSSRYRGLTPTVKVAKVWILVGWATSVAYATTLSSITDSKEVPIEYEDQPLLNSCFVSTISNRTGCEDHLICYPTNRSIKQMEIFHVTTLILFFLVPMFTISLIYYRLVLRLLSQRSSGPSSNTHQAKLRAIQAMVLIVIIFAVCWLPGHIYVIWMFNINAAHSAPIVYRTSVVGRMLNDFVTHLTFNHHWIHTLIYTHYSRQITAAVSQTLGTIIPLATRMTQTRDQPNIGPAVTASMWWRALPPSPNELPSSNPQRNRSKGKDQALAHPIFFQWPTPFYIAHL